MLSSEWDWCGPVSVLAYGRTRKASPPISTGMTTPAKPPLLCTSIGDFPLAECRLQIGDRDLSVLHTDAVLSLDEETRFLNATERRVPYGAVLWPAAIALAHEIATRAAEFRGKTVLELGAGTGLPGIVAAAVGASVIQTDRSELITHVCRMNGKRNRCCRLWAPSSRRLSGRRGRAQRPRADAR